MKVRISLLVGLLAVGVTSMTHAVGIIRITEVMSSSGTGGSQDWFELSNVGDASVDITGWKMDDNSFSFSS